MLTQVDLQLEPNGASDLTPVDEPGLLAAHGWDTAHLTVLDEGPVEDCVAVLGHADAAAHAEGWESHRLHLDAGGKGSVLLDHHPEGDDAGSQHWRLDPLPPGGGPVGATLLHDFGELKRVEGVSEGPGGQVLHVVDEESRVDLRSLLAA